MFFRKSRRFVVLLCLSLFLQCFVPNQAPKGFAAPAETASATAAAPLELQAKSAILIEVSTGQVLFENNSDIPYPPASMSKMMTEAIVLDQISEGKLTWDTVVTTTKNAAATIGSRIFLAEGDKDTVKELFTATEVGSANDAAIALAEHIAGTEENFAKMMNEKAKELGLSESANFINATGLDRADMPEEFQPVSIEGETQVTARDIAKIALNLIRNHPEIFEYSTITSYKFRERDQKPMVNNNWMLEGNKGNDNFKPYVYEGLDGLKTGHTSQAGYCFTGTAERDGMRILSVVMGTTSNKQRFVQTRKLLDHGFEHFELKTLLPAKTDIEGLKKAKVHKGVHDTVKLVAKNNVDFVVQKGEPTGDLTYVAKLKDKVLKAPVKKGDVVGTLTVKYGQATKQVDLIAAEDVKKASWIKLFFRAIGHFFADLFSGIKNIF